MTRKDIVLLNSDIVAVDDIKVNFLSADFETNDDVFGKIAAKTHECELLKRLVPDFEFGTDYSLLDVQNKVFNLVVKKTVHDDVEDEHLFKAFRDIIGQVKKNQLTSLHVPYVEVINGDFFSIMVQALKGVSLTIFVYGAPVPKDLENLDLDADSWEVSRVGVPHLHRVDDCSSFKLPEGFSENNLVGLCEQFTGGYLEVSGIIDSSIKALDDFLLDSSRINRVVFSNVDTSNVESFSCMFANCKCLKSIEGIDSFDTSKAKSLALMFADCSVLEELDVSEFDVSKCQDLYGVFDGCKSLKSLDLSGWDTSQAVDMGKMFRGCRDLEYLNLTGWNTSSIGEDGLCEMFAGCDSLKEVITKNQDILESFQKSGKGVDSMKLF